MAYGPVRCNSCSKEFDLEDHLLCPRCGHCRLTALDQNKQPIHPPTTKITADAVERHALFLEDSGNKSGATMLRDLLKELEEAKQDRNDMIMARNHAVSRFAKMADKLAAANERIAELEAEIKAEREDATYIDPSLGGD